jgi:hypothetical protein
VPFGHSSGGHEQEGECWAKINGTSGHANPLGGTGSHRAPGEAHIAATSSGQSPSMMMVAIVRRRIVSFLRFQADAVIRYAKGTHHCFSGVIGGLVDTPRVIGTMAREHWESHDSCPTSRPRAPCLATAPENLPPYLCNSHAAQEGSGQRVCVAVLYLPAGGMQRAIFRP